MPFPVACAAAAAWWLTLARRARAAQRLCMGFLTLAVAAGLVRDLALRRETRVIEGWQLRVTQWTLENRLTVDEALRVLERDQPHVAVLIDYRRSDRTSNALRRRLRLHHAVAQDGIMLLCRYPVAKRAPPALLAARALAADITAPNGLRVPVLAVATAEPSPDLAAEMAAHLAARAADGPCLMAGALAANRTDARLAPLRRFVRPVFEVAGFGWPYSLRAPVPLFSPDNLWVASGWTVQRAAFRIGPGSAHLRQTAALSPARE